MKIQITNKGQYQITIPRKLALAKGFKKGDSMFWKINKKGDLVLEKDELTKEEAEEVMDHIRWP